MIEQDYVIKKEIKIKMFMKTYKTLISFLEFNENKIFKGKRSHLTDAIESFSFIKENNTIRYQDAFFIMFAFSNNFIEIEKKVKDGNIDFSHIQEESYWEKEVTNFNEALFFSYTFLNSLYKSELEKDFKKLSTMVDTKEYMFLREEVLNKSK